MKKDLLIAVLSGFATGLIWTAIFLRLGTLNFLHLGNAIWGLVVVTMLGFGAAYYVGEWLSKWKPFFSPLVKFAMVGIINTGIDLAVFNLLIYFTAIEKGHELALFKGIGFVAAFVNSYFFNKYWTFNAGSSGHQGKEFIQYTVVTIVGFLLNVGITSGVANYVTPTFGFSQLAWDSVAAIIATVFSLTWNFLGYRLIVFKKSDVASTI